MYDVNADKKYYVVGVVSNGIGCGDPGIPGMYTRVSSYITWLESAAKLLMTP